MTFFSSLFSPFVDSNYSHRVLHTIGRHTDFIIVTSKNITGFLAVFVYSKYLIVPFWFAWAAYHARLVRPNSPDDVAEAYPKVRLGRYNYNY